MHEILSKSQNVENLSESRKSHLKSKNTLIVNGTNCTFQRTMRELNTEVRIMQIDHDKVILDKKVTRHLADKYNIRHISSAPYGHQQNNQVERDMQNALDRSRTICQCTMNRQVCENLLQICMSANQLVSDVNYRSQDTI